MEMSDCWEQRETQETPQDERDMNCIKKGSNKFNSYTILFAPNPKSIRDPSPFSAQNPRTHLLWPPGVIVSRTRYSRGSFPGATE